MLETVPTENEQDGSTSALSTADVADAPADKEMSALEKGRSQEVTTVEKESNQPTNPRRSARERDGLHLT